MVTDSAMLLHSFAPPRSFAALMTLYESNHIRLRALVPQLAGLRPGVPALVSRAPLDCALHLSIRERSRYTTTLHLTYFFEEDGESVADPDLLVRVYHDARMAEALACGLQHRHPLLAGFETRRGSELARRWSCNMMLNKWLEYCAEHGHGRWLPAPQPSRGASV